MKTIALGILFCVSCISLGLSTARRLLLSPHWMPATRIGGPSGLNQPPADDPLRAYAWSVFKSLTVNPDGTSMTIAAWETWKPKCEIGLGAPCASNHNPGPGISLETVRTLLTEIDEETRQSKDRQARAGFSARKQTLGTSKPALEPTHLQMLQAQENFFSSIGPPLQQTGVKSRIKSSASGPILASVMMNNQAVDSIQPLVTSRPTPGNGPTINPGAMLTKAMWTARTLDLPTTKDPEVCLSRHAPFVTTVTWNGKSETNPSLKPTLPNPNTIPVDTSAWSTPEISCADADSPGTPEAPIPISLFHAFGVHTKGVPQASPGQIGTVSTEASGKAALQAECGNKQNCLALMMGIHIMVKVSPADGNFGSDTNPTWVFMTFWWTPDDNNTGLPAPWNHYQLIVTTNPRVDHADGTADNIIFSPYLEGIAPPAGAEANCVTCHSLARYNANMTGDELRSDGSTCGNLSIGQLAPKDCGDSGKYLADSNSVQIDKVWSIVSLLDSSKTHARSLSSKRQLPSK